MEKNRRAHWAVAAAVAFILVLTLVPTRGEPETLSACIVCGARGVADALLNVLLFMPLGAALAWVGLALLRAVPLGFALTVLVETTQHWVPGRDPSLGDVVTNTVGTALGVAAFTAAPGVLAWARRRLTPLSLLLSVSTVAGLALGAVLLRPALPAGPYFPAWHSEAAHPVWFGGEVREARLAELPLLRRRIRDGARVRALWLAGAPLRVQVVRPATSPELEPVFALYDGPQHELLLLAFEGDDLLLRFRTLSAAVRLDAPELRLQTGRWGDGEMGSVGRPPASGVPDGAGSPHPPIAPSAVWPKARPLPGAPGSPTIIEARREGSGYCLALDGRERCGLGYGVARSWAVLMYPSLTPAGERLLDALWLFCLFLPSGLLLRRRAAPFALGLPLLALALLPLASGLRPTPPEGYAAVLLGFAAGAGLTRAAARRLRGRQAAGTAASPRTARASSRRQRSMRS